MTSDAPLQDVVVTELGGRIGAAVCGSVLAQLGATVVVPEMVGDRAGKERHRAVLMAGKLSLGLDPADGGDARLLDRLVARSDVLIVASDVDRRPLDDGRRRADAADPARIVCDITAFGASGPLTGTPASDLEIQALTGILATTGPADGPPAPIRVPVVEFMTGIYAAAACQAALRVVRQGGAGQAIDMSLYDCAFAAMSTFLPKLVSGAGGDVGRIGNRHAMAAPWNVYRARDGWLLLCAASDDQWRRIAEVIGRPELGGDPRYLRVADRVQRVGEVDAAVGAWIGTGTVAQRLERLAAAGIPSGPVTVVDGHPREANLDHRRMVRLLRDPVSDRDVHVPASPLRMTATPGLSPDRIPAPGADRAAVMRLVARPRRDTPPAASGRPAGALPLAGVRVIEIGHYTTAPLSARHLASLGADVIKVEPLAGEAVRGWPPARDGTGYFFNYTNSDKRSLALDLETADGITILRDLVQRSDVLLENLKPGALAKRGCSAEALLGLNPRLVYCAVSGFGADSIYAGRPAFDTVIQAMSGIMDLTRTGDTPVKTGISSADIAGAEMAVVAILAALEARDRRGSGQAIDLSMQDVAAWLTMPAWNGGDAVAPAPAVLEAADGHVVVLGRRGEAQALPAGLSHEAVRGMPRAELTAALAASGWRSAPVLTVREVLDAAQTHARRLVFTVQDDAGDTWPLLASPLGLTGTPPEVRRPMAPLGRDNAAILAELGRASPGRG